MLHPTVASSIHSTLVPETRIRFVHSFEELASARFADGINALCWLRTLNGDFSEVIRQLGPGEGIVPLEKDVLQALELSPAGRRAAKAMLEDAQRLHELGLQPELNCIHNSIVDATDAPVATDVCSFHADRATVEASTWLCTYHGTSSEGLRNEEAVRKIDIPETRAALLRWYGGADDQSFSEFLEENCFDLHYTPLPGAQPFTFGTGNLWRIAIEHPACPVPPCIHRAPDTQPGDVTRLLLIS